jgi:cytochrome c peroxidase
MPSVPKLVSWWVLAAVSLCLGQAVEPPATQRARLPARPQLSEHAYVELARDLRATYSKPSSEWPKPELDPGIEHREIGLLPPVKFPKNNPYSKPKAELGKALFFSPELSSSGAIACASCHDPDLAWADGRTVAFGHNRQAGKRNTPSLLFSAYTGRQFWDGRADGLEDQVRNPIVAENEMNADPAAIIQRLGRSPELSRLFADAFGDATITMDRVALAIATFERTMVVGRSRFDAFVSGRNREVMSDSAVRGLHLFRTSARCMNCHNGPEFSDGQFHNVGLSYYRNPTYRDLGRYEVTRDPRDVGAFKTPSLRNVSRTEPLMHNGLFDLPGVLRMYNNGMADIRPRNDAEANDPLFPVKSPLLRSLGLNKQDLSDLQEFLNSLAEPKLRVRPPVLSGPPTTAGEDPPD